MKRFKIFSGSYGTALTERICADPIINLPVGRCKVDKFSDGEIEVEYIDEVRGEEVYIVQPHISAKAIVEQCIMIDAACRSSAHAVIAVCPYLGYMRQERKSKPRTPISAKWIIDTLINSGANRLLAIDLHAGAIQGFADARHPFDNLYAGMSVCDFFRKIYEAMGINIKTDVFTVAPDNGSSDRVRALSDRFRIDTRVIIDKKRNAANESKLMNIIGDFKEGQRALILDDILDTGGTAVNAAKALVEKGASKVDIGIIHGVLSGPAIERLIQSPDIENVVITDTYPLAEEKNINKIKVISIAPMLAQAIKNLNREMSVSALFDVIPPYTILKK